MDPEHPNVPSRAATAFRVAWLSILLGVAMEALLLVVATAFGRALLAKPVLADSIQKISWSAIVCMGLALGTATSRMRGAAMGIAGFLAAPIAFYVARAFHKGANQALGLMTGAAAGPSPLALATVKAVEYACLGVVLGWAGKRQAGALAYAAIGLVVGILFGGALLAMAIASAPQPPATAEIVARAANEMIFPVGCSLVLYAAQFVGDRFVAPATTRG